MPSLSLKPQLENFNINLIENGHYQNRYHLFNVTWIVHVTAAESGHVLVKHACVFVLAATLYSIIEPRIALLSRVMRKLAFSICQNKDADQLRGS